jgi:hypothetical protein
LKNYQKIQPLSKKPKTSFIHWFIIYN